MEHKHTPHILWLASWYPNKQAPFDGDFIQRHAKAVGNFHDIQVIYVVRDNRGTITRDVKMEEFESGNVREKIIYYYSAHFSFPLIEKFFSNLKYKRLFKKAVLDYFNQFGQPHLIHVHIAMKAGLIAKWIKRKFRIPYVISEHWTGYLPEAKEKLSNFPFYLKTIWRKIIKSASGVSVVSDYLGACIKKDFFSIGYKIIPNVVDLEIFKPATLEKNKNTRFIHISGLDYQKDPESILKAFSILNKKCSDFHLSIIGPERKELFWLTVQLGLESQVSFHSEMPQKDLVKFVQQSDALILYSRYETFGCVIIEANACGVPVIVSDLKVFHEIIKENENGIFAPGERPGLLAEKLLWFIQNQQQFDHSAIATRAQSEYNYKVVGEQFSKWYDSVLGNS